MDYTLKSLAFLSPRALSRCLLAGPPNPRARPYRVSNWNRTLRKGVVAESLQDLLEKICTTLPVFGSITLVLEEDGTTVDTEEFFQTLPDGTVFLALTKGQSWRPVKAPGDRLSRSRKPRGCHDIACVTLDLYKTRPQDFIGCLNFRATLFGVYSVSYDMRCCGARRVAKEALRWTLYAMQATGHVLLGASSYVQQLLDSTEEAVEKDNSSVVLHRLGSLPSRNMLE